MPARAVPQAWPRGLPRAIGRARPTRPAAPAGRWAVAVDAGLALLLAAVAWPFSWLRPANPAELASLVLMLVAVAVRRAWPWAAWSLGLAGGLIQVADGLPGLVALLGVVLVLYSVTAYGPRVMLLLTGVILPLAAVAGTITLILRGTSVLRLISGTILPGSVPGGTTVQGVVLYLAVLTPLAATYLAGLARRSVLAAQRAAVRESLAAADSARAAQLAAAQGQRADLAREVHDVVGHSLAVIIAQADSVRFRDMNAADGPEQVQATVAAIAATARDSLGEIREVLGRLGQPEQDQPGQGQPGQGQPGQAGRPAADTPAGDTLPELFARVRQAGVELTVRHEGEPSDAGPDERAVLVAVTREMLTNALRHGDRAAPVDVLLRWSGDGMMIRVRNREGNGDGTGPARPGAGRGIPGMRVRLGRVGGRLGTAREPCPDGGQDFIADAWVPVGAA